MFSYRMIMIYGLFACNLCHLAAQELQKDSIRRLDAVTVSMRTRSYKVDTITSVTRTKTTILQTPQSIQVVSRQTMVDRQAYTLNDLSSVMTGVKANNGMGSFSMRGFTGYNPFNAGFLTFNGIRGNLYLWSQAPLLYNIEQVEVLKGPASVLFSEGSPGGIINFTTKKPLEKQQLQLDAAYGSWESSRLALDLTGPLTTNKKLLYRGIVGLDKSKSFRDYQLLRNAFFAPSLRYAPNAASHMDLEVNYAYARAVQQYDRGAFVYTKPDGSFDFNHYPIHLTAQSPSDYGKTHNTSVTWSYENQVSDRLKLTLLQRYVRSKFDYTDHIVTGVIRNDSISRGYQDWLYDQFNWQSTAFAELNVQTKEIAHRLLTGVDYNNYGWSKNDYRNSPATRISILHPNYSMDPPAVDPAKDYYDDNKQTIHLIGAYVQDQLSYKDLILLLSLRYDSYRLFRDPLSDRDAEQGNRSFTDAWVPRVGAVYQPLKVLSFYGSYTRSFNPQNSNGVKNGGPFPPRIATQYEVGAKSSLLKDRIGVMFALYDIQYSNILAAAPTAENPNFQVLLDGTRSKGLETSIQGALYNISVMLGYAYNDHVLTSDNSIGKKGTRYVNAPKHLANIWLKYGVFTGYAKGLSVGIGGRYMSDQVGFQSAPDFLIPASVVCDGMLSYSHRQWGLQLNMYNLSKERYYTGGNSRTVTASLGNPFNLKFGLNYTLN